MTYTAKTKPDRSKKQRNQNNMQSGKDKRVDTEKEKRIEQS